MIAVLVTIILTPEVCCAQPALVVRPVITVSIHVLVLSRSVMPARILVRELLAVLPAPVALIVRREQQYRACVLRVPIMLALVLLIPPPVQIVPLVIIVLTRAVVQRHILAVAPALILRPVAAVVQTVIAALSGLTAD